MKIPLRTRFFISYMALAGITLVVFTGVLDYQLSQHALRFAERFNVEFNAQTVRLEGVEKTPPLFMREVEDSIVWTALGVSILAAFLSAGMAGYLSRPIQTLTASTRMLARGRYTAPIEIKSQDELGELAAAFNAMSTSIQEHEYVQKQLITNLAHELGTPLTNLSGYLDALKDGLIVEEKRLKTYEILRAEVDRLRGMLEDVRALALTEEKHLTLKKEPCQIHALIETMIDTIKPQFKSKSIALKRSKNEEDFEVVVDRNRFIQIGLNLLQNALKYSSPKTEVLVRVAQTKTAWTMQVIDQGEGIPKEECPYIFDRFYRVEKSRTRGEKSIAGQGIGLAVVKALVEAHEGKIEVESTVGQGSTFTLTFPRKS